MTRIIESLADIAQDYDALFCDLWGCVHNGLAAYPDAVAVLKGFRAGGGQVVLLTNAPRPWREIAAQIEGLGIPRDAWDAIATSGDSARLAMFEGAVGRKVYFIGEPRDLSFFGPMHLAEGAPEIARVPLAQAEGIVCTGPFDPHADPAVNRADFLYAKTKGLKLLCANPDIVVDRGESREWCAGALAALYTEMGGESLYFGKPHPPVYDLARRRLRPRRASVQCAHPCRGRRHPDRHPRRHGRGDRFALHHRRPRPARDRHGAAARSGRARRLRRAEMAEPTYAIGFLR
jgi:HAD superfamily hydrolase (TIGR01459 family)